MSTTAAPTASTPFRSYNLGPLTTTEFNPPADCNSVQARCSTCSEGWRAQSCLDWSVSDDRRCWPKTAEGIAPTDGPLYGWGLYSPGLVCPAGYTSAAEATYGGQGNFQFGFALEPEETGVACCPEDGFSATVNPNGQTCQRIYSRTTLKAGNCLADGTETYSQVTLPTSYRGADEVSAFIVQAPLFQIVWKSSDRPADNTALVTSVFTTESNGNVITRTETFPAATDSSGSSNPDGSSSGSSGSSSNDLSTGAKAGIAIGAAFAAILLGMLAFFLWRRSKNGRAGGHDGSHPNGTSELPGYMSKPGEAGEPPTEIQSRPWGTRGVVEVNPDYPVEIGSYSPEPFAKPGDVESSLSPSANSRESQRNSPTRGFV